MGGFLSILFLIPVWLVCYEHGFHVHVYTTHLKIDTVARQRWRVQPKCDYFVRKKRSAACDIEGRHWTRVHMILIVC